MTKEFIRRVQHFVAENLRPRREAEQRYFAVGRDVRILEDMELQRRIHAAGFGYGASFSPEDGGHGATAEQDRIWREATAGYWVPDLTFAISFGMCVPIIRDLGTVSQRKKYLPAALAGETLFAQLFSEPSAGSDLAGLRMRAVRDRDGWRITGQKVWTSNAQFSDYGILLARTDVHLPKHRGITMFIVPLKSPHVEVRSLRVINGEAPFNEVYFNDLYVSDDDRIGEVNQGWRAAIQMLRYERLSIGSERSTDFGAFSLEKLRGTITQSDLSLAVRQSLIAEVFLREFGMAALAEETALISRSDARQGALGSVAKAAGAIAAWELIDLVGENLPDLLAFHDDQVSGLSELEQTYLTLPGRWSAGGTIEVQLSIIGERVLGLEKEPGVPGDTPFKDIPTSATGRQPPRTSR